MYGHHFNTLDARKLRTCGYLQGHVIHSVSQKNLSMPTRFMFVV